MGKALVSELLRQDYCVAATSRNKKSLANWEVKGVKMTLTSDSIASIDLRLHLPAQFKFTRGSWEREAIISNADTGNQIIHDAEHATRIYRLWERNPWMGE